MARKTGFIQEAMGLRSQLTPSVDAVCTVCRHKKTFAKEVMGNSADGIARFLQSIYCPGCKTRTRYEEDK